MEPNRENIALWVQALRSGEFEQGTEWLNRDGKFCCLGVACEVAIGNGVELSTETDRGAAVHYSNGLHSPTAKVLPTRVREWLGLAPGSTDPYVRTARELHDPQYGTIPAGNSVQLTACNDIYKLDFATIATMIEDTYLKESV